VLGAVLGVGSARDGNSEVPVYFLKAKGYKLSLEKWKQIKGYNAY
jgi:hypothetical protein